MHTASVTAYNFGVKAFYFGRKAEAEQWMGMAYKLSKHSSTIDKQSTDKINQVLNHSCHVCLCLSFMLH